MMRSRLFSLFAIASAVALSGCGAIPSSRFLGQEGPGRAPAECAEVPPSPATPESMNQAVADGGQKASNHPVQSDPGARGVHTVWSRGAGASSDSSTTTETRQQAGAPSVNQGLQIPTSSEVNAGGTPTLAIQKAAATIDVLNAALSVALSKGQDPGPILAQLSGAQKALTEAQAASANVSTFNYQGATINLTVANGSAAGSEGGSVSAPASRTPRASTGTATAPGAPTVVQPTATPPPPPAPDPATPAGMEGG